MVTSDGGGAVDDGTEAVDDGATTVVDENTSAAVVVGSYAVTSVVAAEDVSTVPAALCAPHAVANISGNANHLAPTSHLRS